MKNRVRSILLTILLVAIIINSFSLVPSFVKAADDASEWSAVFDPDYYREHSEGARKYAGDNDDLLWTYFIKAGIPNREQASEEFNVDIYMKNYPELVKQYGDSYVQYYVHYTKIGKSKGYNGKTLNDASVSTASVSTASVSEASISKFPEGYIIVGESNVKGLETAANLLMDSKTGRIEGFESAIYSKSTLPDCKNIFFVIDSSNIGVDYIYADGKSNKSGVAVTEIHKIMNSNTGIKHWNIISLHGQKVDEANYDAYIKSYNNWITKEFEDANVYVFSQDSTNTLFNGKLKNALGKNYIGHIYSITNDESYKSLLVDILTKVRQARVSCYEPNEVGFLILSECHSDILLWSIPNLMEDKKITSTVPKENIVPMSSKSHNYPDYFAGGVTVNFEGNDYEADSIINGLMEEHPNVKFWYIVYFAGSNYIRNIGANKAMDYAKSNLETIANKTYYADNTIALMTTPPMYNRGKASEKLVDSYDDLEMEYMKSIGYTEYAYDTRDDFSEYVNDKVLKRVEFPGYRYGSSGDGLHFYGKQYWIVTINAVNEIYKQSRGE